jgi:dTDP-4-dehydrorhamnose 3,5-epimerase
MRATETKLSGCFVIEPNVFKDDRGYFFESYNQDKFEAAIGKKVNFIQDNEAFSSYGVLRGLHFQTGSYAQAKLVRVLQGTVVDVAVDLRKESDTFGQYFAIELSAENKLQLFVPRGFGHGYAVLSDTAAFAYKVDNTYSKENEGGIVWNDKSLNIDWKIAEADVLLSDKDKVLPTLEEYIKL